MSDEPAQSCYRSDDESLPMQLHRAGISLYWSFVKNCYVAQSKYILHFHGAGGTEDEALADYSRSIQKPLEWRNVIYELFSDIPYFAQSKCEYEEFGLDEIRFGYEMENPMRCWLDVLNPVFAKAYEAPRNDELIAKTFAFAEWSSSQFWQEETDDGRELSSAYFVCFFEEISMFFMPALEELPEWYDLREIDEWIRYYPFTDEHRDRILDVYRSANCC